MWIDFLLLGALLGITALLVTRSGILWSGSASLWGRHPAVHFPPPSLPTTYLTRWARQAGLEPETSMTFLWPAKVVLMLFTGTGVWLAASNLGHPWRLLFVLVFAGLGFFLVDAAIWWLRRRRQEQIQNGLSLFLDLLTALLRSGAGPDAALLRAAEQEPRPGHPLYSELRRVGRELEAGRDRPEVLQSLFDRTGVADLGVLGAALELGGRLGAPLVETLAAQAELQRQKRLEAGKRQIDRALLKALIPVFLCGYPAFFVLLVLPALSEILETFRVLGSVFP